jgi:predicted nuclease of predicted toxin-antitoxin system
VAIAGLSILLHFDHNGHPLLAQDIRNAGYDAVAAKDVGIGALKDEEHLQWATDHGRCIITHDLDDYPVLAYEWARIGRDHAGIIVALQPPKISYGEMLRRLLRLLDTLTADEMVNRLEWLDLRWSDRLIGSRSGFAISYD